MRRKIYKSINDNGGRINAYPIDDYARSSIRFATLAIIIGIISYMILISLSVWNANKRTSYEKEIAQKSALVVELEARLTSIDKGITQNLALARGFIETHNIKYVTTKPPTTALRSNEMAL